MIKRLALALAALVLLRADMYQDASNAKLPEALQNLGIPVSVLAYGAKCDGTTDDTAAIQAAAATPNRITFPTGTTCLAADITFGSVKHVDCQGAIIKAPPGSAGKWIFKRTGSFGTLQNCIFDDLANNTMVSTTLAATAAPGATVLTLASTANLAVGMPMSIRLDSGIDWVTRIDAIAGSTITVATGIPNSATAVAIAGGGDKYNGNDAMIALGGTGFNAPLVLKGTRPAGAGPITAVEVKVPGLYDTPPANPVRFQSNGSRQYVPATVNVTWAGAASGAAVKAAYGLLYSQAVKDGQISHIRINGAPVGIHFAGTEISNNNNDRFTGFVSNGNVIAGFFRDRNVGGSFFKDGVVFCAGGAVGAYANAEDSTVNSGGNTYHNVQVLGCQTNWMFRRSGGEDQQIVSDNANYYHVIFDKQSDTRAQMSVGSGSGTNEDYAVGVHVGDSTGIGIYQLRAAHNGTDLNVGDAISSVYLGQQMGTGSGTGHYITGNAAGLRSARAYLTAQTGTTLVGGAGSTIYVGPAGYSATQAGATWYNPEYLPTVTKLRCQVATAPGVGNNYLCKFQFELIDTPLQCTIADAATNCLVTTPTFMEIVANLRSSVAIVSSAGAPANQFWVSTAGQN